MAIQDLSRLSCDWSVGFPLIGCSGFPPAPRREQLSLRALRRSTRRTRLHTSSFERLEKSRWKISWNSNFDESQSAFLWLAAAAFLQHHDASSYRYVLYAVRRVALVSMTSSFKQMRKSKWTISWNSNFDESQSAFLWLAAAAFLQHHDASSYRYVLYAVRRVALVSMTSNFQQVQKSMWKISWNSNFDECPLPGLKLGIFRLKIFSSTK